MPDRTQHEQDERDDSQRLVQDERDDFQRGAETQRIVDVIKSVRRDLNDFRAEQRTVNTAVVEQTTATNGRVSELEIQHRIIKAIVATMIALVGIASAAFAGIQAFH